MKYSKFLCILLLSVQIFASEPGNSKPKTPIDTSANMQNNISDITNLSVNDILEIRTLAIAQKLHDTANIVEQLCQIIEHDPNSMYIHSFAAEQALFCTNSPKVEEVLKKRINAPIHHSQDSINYTYHWHMPEPQRSKFIDLHPKFTHSDIIKITLSTKPGPEYFENSISIVATITNISAKTINYVDDDFPLENKLYFRKPEGTYIRNLQLGHKDFPIPKAVKLHPGESYNHQTYLMILEAKPSHSIYNKYLIGHELWVTDGSHNAFLIEKPGEFEIIAIFEYYPVRSQWLTQTIGIDNFWTGQAASQPIKVTFKIPE